MKKFKEWFVAFFRLNEDSVCKMSESEGEYDYHDYPDDILGFPDHFVLLQCKRCGKRFRI